MQLTFVHVDGSKKGQTEVFNQPVVAVGRDPSNQLVFDPYKDTDVSTRHAQFLFQGENLLIQDMGSRNGTFVNGQRVGSSPTPVPVGAIVQFGDKGPKVQVTYKAAPAAPGKKTQMIADLQQQMQSQQKAAAASKSKTVMLFLFLIVFGGGGYAGYTWWDARKLRQEAIAQAAAKLPELKKDAEAKETLKYAAADLKNAQTAEQEADAAKTAGRLDVAAVKYADALRLYESAINKAEKNKQAAQLDQLQQALAAKSKEEQAQTAARKTELDDAQKKKADAEQARIKELEAKLAAAKTVNDLKPLVDAALKSNKVDEVEKAVTTVSDKAKAPADQGGGDPQLQAWVKSLQQRVADLKAIPDKLDKAANASKPVVVAVQTTAYALPKGQTEKTTQIRELVAFASGTGFLVTKDKIATSKSLIEPWKFDAASLALAKKWEELGYTIHARTDVLTLDVAGVYTSTATTNPEMDTPTLRVVFTGPDAFVDAPVEKSIVFKDGTYTVKVQPHKHEVGNIAVLQLTQALNATPLSLAPADAKTGDQVIVLVQQKAQQGGGESRLFAQQTEITTRPGSGDAFLGVGGYNTWEGACVLNPDGQVVGLIDEVQGEWMRMMSLDKIKDGAGLK